MKKERTPLFVIFREDGSFNTEFGTDVQNSMDLEYALYTFMLMFMDTWFENLCKNDMTMRDPKDDKILD